MEDDAPAPNGDGLAPVAPAVKGVGVAPAYAAPNGDGAAVPAPAVAKGEGFAEPTNGLGDEATPGSAGVDEGTPKGVVAPVAPV